MPITIITGMAQNGTIGGVSIASHLRDLETRYVRITIEVLPGDPGKDPNHGNESSKTIPL